MGLAPVVPVAYHVTMIKTTTMDDSALAARIRTQAEELNATIMAARASGITVSLYVRTESVVGWHETDGVYVKAIRREL